MNNIKYIITSVLLTVTSGLFAQVPISFERTYGETQSETGSSAIETFDEGFALVGETNSIGSGGFDCFLVRTDVNGDTLWTKTYGGANDDMAYSIIQTTDSGYAITGSTQSYGAGGQDVYLIKTNSTGDTLWTKTIGGIGDEFGSSVQQTDDGGYIITGTTDSYGAGSDDMYLIKTDALGDTLWTKTVGGAFLDKGYSVKQTHDGGYIVSGTTRSYGGNAYDVLLVKTDNLGDTLWTNTYDVFKADHGYDVIETSDTNYVVAGTVGISGATQDFFLAKTDTLGNTAWTRYIDGTYSLSSDDYAFSLAETYDGGYILAGNSDVTGMGENVLLVKTDDLGFVAWTKTYGGATDEYAYTVVEAADSGFAILGVTDSYGAGLEDFYFLKTKQNGCIDYNMSIQFVAGTPTFCYHDTVNLILDSNLVNYMWSTGETTIDISTNQPGTYFGQATDITGCITAYSDTITIGYYPTYSNIISLGTTIPICYSDSMQLNAENPGFASYSWFNGSTASSIYVLDTGYLDIAVIDTNNCQTMDTLSLLQLYPQRPEICLVTVDSTSTKNIVVWDKPITSAIDSFRVYRNIVGTYYHIGTVDYDSISQYVDTTNGVNPNITSYRYKVSAVDTCGDESQWSEFHESIHNTVSIGLNGEMNLVWDNYEGFPFLYYRIMRDTIGNGTFHLIDTVSYTNFTYTDLTPPVGPLGYLVEVVPPSVCSATKSQDHNTTRSNRHTMVEANPNGISAHSNDLFRIYPNPTDGDIFINLLRSTTNMATISITNLLGQEVFRDRIKLTSSYFIDGSKLKTGMYLIHIKVGEKTYSEKLIYK